VRSLVTELYVGDVRWATHDPGDAEVEALTLIVNNLQAIGQRTLQQISIIGMVVGLAIVTGVPLGIAITQC
jgi:ABC-type proline/glycine betaine transport system permease subunit